MAEAPAPTAPSAPAQAAPAAPASATKAPTPEVHVTAESVRDSGPSQPAPKKGSARERMFADLRKKTETPSSPETAHDQETKPPEPSGESKPPESTAAPEAPGDKKKVNPWKLLDEHKAARAKAEAEIAELRKQIADPAKAKEMEDTFKKMEARNKELEEEIRFVNFAKSREFDEKYQKPYTDAWKKAMEELSELVIEDPSTGQERAVQATDLLEIVNLPLQKAREAANRVFGDFADDVMAHRKEIKSLFESQQKALKEAKEAGAARDEQRTNAAKEYFERVRKEVSELWTRTNESVLKDEKIGPMFRPVEGDEEGNKRLSKGFEMADKAFSMDVRKPGLTAEERENIVKLHVAVRNRAAAFGRAVYQLSQAQARIKALSSELAKYKAAEPGKGDGKPSSQPQSRGSARDSVFGALRNIAH